MSDRITTEFKFDPKSFIDAVRKVRDEIKGGGK